jgi:tetratricopeptide (TPR) repeat protein
MNQAARNGPADLSDGAGHALALLVMVGLSACTSLPEHVRQYGEAGRPVELSDTPFFPQERYQCGPAALMTVLTQSGVNTTLDSIVEQVYLPGRRGSLQTELLAAARASSRIPYQIDSSLSAIVGELQAGRSVLVLQNLGVSWMPRWHYAVVVGADPSNDTITLRSGTNRRRITKTKTFLRTWERGEYWGLVVIRPDELPANPDANRYFRAIAALESTGHVAEARSGWRVALERWPNEPVAMFGAANSEFALSNFADAEDLYRQLLDKDPDSLSARNNLAHAIARQGRNAEAMREIRLALDMAKDDGAMQAELQDSLAEIQQSELLQNE